MTDTKAIQRYTMICTYNEADGCPDAKLVEMNRVGKLVYFSDHESALTAERERIAELEDSKANAEAQIKALAEFLTDATLERDTLREEIGKLADHADVYLPFLVDAVMRDSRRQQDIGNRHSLGDDALNAIRSVFSELRKLIEVKG